MPADDPTNPARIRGLLHRWLARQIDEKGLAWLSDNCQRIAEGSPDHVFFAAFSAVPRHTGKQDLHLTKGDVQAAGAERTGWESWSVDQAGRVLLLLSLKVEDAGAFAAKLEKVSTCADLGELVAIYQGLPLLPYPERHRALAAEGVRSNMTAVFNAVALRNSYPADHFGDAAWNQMVLKAVFVGSPLHLIYGLDRRSNPKLAHMLTSYAHERWAAKRPVPPELWRPVGPYADETIVADLEKVLTDPDPVQQKAAALALSQSASPRATELLTQRADLHAAIAQGRLTWSSFTHPPQRRADPS